MKQKRNDRTTRDMLCWAEEQRQGQIEAADHLADIAEKICESAPHCVSHKAELAQAVRAYRIAAGHGAE